MLASFWGFAPISALVSASAPLRRRLAILLLSTALHGLAVSVIPSGQGLDGASQQVQAATVLQARILPAAAKGKGVVAEVEKEALMVERHSTMAATPAAPADAAETVFGIFSPSEPRYYKTTELSERPKVVRDIPKDLTEKLPEGIAGDAILNLKISESGTIEGVSIEASSLDTESLDQLRQAVEKMRFTPGKVGRESVKTELRIQVTIEDLRGFHSPR